MKKKTSCLFLILLPIIYLFGVNEIVYTEEQKQSGQGNIGFYGSYESPESEETIESAETTTTSETISSSRQTNNFQTDKQLPRTGEEKNNYLSLIGIGIISLIVLLWKKREKDGKKE